jgi:hypothetical protein
LLTRVKGAFLNGEPAARNQLAQQPWKETGRTQMPLPWINAVEDSAGIAVQLDGRNRHGVGEDLFRSGRVAGYYAVGFSAGFLSCTHELRRGNDIVSTERLTLDYAPTAGPPP